MEEIKLELRQDNINVKCNAVAKLTYVSIPSRALFLLCFELAQVSITFDWIDTNKMSRV